MEILTKIKEEVAAFKLKKEALIESLRNEFPQLFKPIFDKSQKIESIAFTCYTPYFNDGDECTYHTNVDELEINGEGEYDTPWFDWRVGRDNYKDTVFEPEIDVEECLLIGEFKAILSSIPEDFYRDLFGDHIKVIINKDGSINIEGYEHE